MDAKKNILTALCKELQESNMNPTQEDQKIIFSPLESEFRIADFTVNETNNKVTLKVVFDAAPIGLESEGIQVTAVGSGNSLEEAAKFAAYQWYVGFFPVYHNYITDPHHSDMGVMTFDFLVQDMESGERFPRKARLGQIISMVYGEEKTSEGTKPEMPNQLDIIKFIFNEISSISTHKNLIWLELFASQLPDGKVDATCLLRNKPWEEGRLALLEYASKWPNPFEQVLTQRQFVIIEYSKQKKAELEKLLDKETAKSKKSLFSGLFKSRKE